MNKPQGFDETKAQRYIGRPKPGYYVCEILKMAEELTKENQEPMMVLLLDITQGPHAGYFRKQLDLDRRKKPDSKFKGVFRSKTTNVAKFKANCEKIEESNSDFKFLFDGTDEQRIRGKLIGVAIGDEEFINNAGDVMVARKIRYLLTVKEVKIKNADGDEPPKLLKLRNGMSNQGWSGDPNEPIPDYTGDPGPEEDLPF
jgi:hypothetical protein